MSDEAGREPGIIDEDEIRAWVTRQAEAALQSFGTRDDALGVQARMLLTVMVEHHVQIVRERNRGTPIGELLAGTALIAGMMVRAALDQVRNVDEELVNAAITGMLDGLRMDEDHLVFEGSSAQAQFHPRPGGRA